MSEQQSQFIDFRAIKAAVSMEQILEHYDLREKLRAIGAHSLTGCCPIHKGTNPTQFRVSLAKNCWNCFSSCKCGGNVLDFVSRMEGVPIQKAARLAAEWFNVQLPSAASGRQQRDSDEQEGSRARVADIPSKDVSAEALDAPAESAAPNKPLAFELKHLDPEYPYFAEREITPECVAEFGLGYCKKGILSGRIAIPIHNGEGSLVAYAGRWPGPAPEEKSKYQFPKGFRKSLEVFNLHRARRADPESPLIIVEGFFDCMKLWQAGVPRVVALMGSALSAAQEKQITAVVGSKGLIALMLDDDEAGHTGRVDALRRFASHAYVRIIELRNYGNQPDELSTDAIQELLLREESPAYGAESVKFPLGRLVATPNALHALSESDIRTAISRHAHGDWGNLEDDDRFGNERALRDNLRLLSAYDAANGTKFWVITEADRSATTVLLPEDY